MAGAAHTMPVIPQAPKRAERASFKKDMKKIGSVVQKIMPKSSKSSSTDAGKSDSMSEKTMRPSYSSSRTSTSTFAEKPAVTIQEVQELKPSSRTPKSTSPDRTTKFDAPLAHYTFCRA